MAIATLVVYKNKACLAFATDVAEDIQAAPVDVDVALTFEEMVM